MCVIATRGRLTGRRFHTRTLEELRLRRDGQPNQRE